MTFQADDDARDTASTPEEGLARAAAMADRIRGVAEPVIKAHRCEIVSLEWRREPVGWVLRLYVEHLGHDPRLAIGGVGIDECAKISRDLGMALEVAELIDHAYHLEISSPGLERPLAKLDDYRRFTGLRAKVQLREALAAFGTRKVFRGEILGAGEDDISLREDDVGEVRLPFERIAKANLIYEAAAKPKPGKQRKDKKSHRHDTKQKPENK